MQDTTKAYSHDRIRLGYLSSDFCSHALGYLIVELFEQHNRAKFEVFGYCSSPDDGSDLRTRVIRSFDHFKIIKHLPDEQAAQMIRDDEIDILIDLNGLTTGQRLQILRSKPAPVQVTYLGFVGPVPLPELDYMLCDDVVVPVDLASAYEPQPLYIASNYQANDSKRVVGSDMEKRHFGLTNDKFIFCNFCPPHKITEAVFMAWMEILHRSPGSILWVLADNEWARSNMLNRALQSGIDAARIVFAPRVVPSLYMARLRLADVFLDTFPYNAGTIASDAIRMGLPLVTLSGRSFASRMAGSLLRATGAGHGITTSLPDYIKLAVLLATDKATLDAHKSLVGMTNWHRGIGDIAAFTTSYENSLIAVTGYSNGRR
jgi:predicted O-linked N-acetylglucosamine transferase (SPINDLY family)